MGSSSVQPNRGSRTPEQREAEWRALVRDNQRRLRAAQRYDERLVLPEFGDAVRVLEAKGYAGADLDILRGMLVRGEIDEARSFCEDALLEAQNDVLVRAGALSWPPSRFVKLDGSYDDEAAQAELDRAYAEHGDKVAPLCSALKALFPDGEAPEGIATSGSRARTRPTPRSRRRSRRTRRVARAQAADPPPAEPPDPPVVGQSRLDAVADLLCGALARGAK